MKLARRIALVLGLSVAAVAVGAPPAHAYVPYTGYVLHKSGNYLYLWNPGVGEGWRWSAFAYTCDPYEWYNGSKCPLSGGGGGGSW